jgi:hypothetical protein
MPDIVSNLVSHWAFEEGAGTSLDDPISGNDGTIFHSGGRWVSDAYGVGFDFPQNGRALCGNNDSLNLTSEGTFQWRHKLDDLGAANLGRFFERSSGSTGYAASCVSSTGNKVQFLSLAGGSGIVSSSTISFGVGEFWAITWDGTSVVLYKNGVEAGSGTLSNAIASASGADFYIADRSASDRDLDGVIYEMRAYSRALSAEDIAYLYDPTEFQERLLIIC